EILYPESWRSTINPYARLAQGAANRWFRELGVVDDVKSERILADERPDLYGGLPYPTASYDRLTLITKYLALWMLFDDLVAESGGALSLGDYAIALEEGDLPPNADPWLRGWWCLGQAFSDRMSPAWCRRLQGAFLDWLKMTVKERESWRVLREPDVQTYIDV